MVYKMKTLVLYVFHEYNDNVDFFLKYGVIEQEGIDYLMIINHPTRVLKMEFPKNVRIINRDNIGYDFGGWSHGLFLDNLYLQYDYFIFINSSVRGPFLPSWYPGNNWVELFTRRLDIDVKLVGTTVNHAWFEKGQCIPHVQSMVMATDRVGLEVGIQRGIFSPSIIDLSYKDAVNQKELAFSSYILDAGYNIACLLSAYRDYDFRNSRQSIDFSQYPYQPYDSNHYLSKQYFGLDIHPYEVIFVKTAPYATHIRPYIDKYTEWLPEKASVVRNVLS